MSDSKVIALAHAVTVSVGQSVEVVLDAAAKFEAYLMGATAPKATTKAVKATTAATPAATAAATPAAAAEPAAPAGPTKKDVTAKVQALIQADLKDQCGEILEKYGSAVRNVSSIPVEKYAAFIAAADELLSMA